MKKNIIIIALLAVAVVAVVEIKNRKNAGGDFGACPGGTCTLPVPVGAAPSDPGEPARQSLPRLLDLGSGTCVPCKMMAPILEELKATFAGQLEVEFIDVWQNEGAGEQYGIRLIPTQVFFDPEGRELFRHEGFISRDDLLAKWRELGFEFEQKE